MENRKTYLKTIPFSEFNLWDVKRYNHLMSFDFENAVLLRDILNQYKVKISKDELIENDWKIISKINFQGQLFLRTKEEIKTYKGSLNKVPENSIIYSKINVRHGCVYYHENGKIPFGVSTEYPTFLFNKSQINGYYLKMLLRSSEFKRLLNTKTSGISKARVKIDEFLDIKIPLSSLSEQNRIVENYNTKIKLAQKQEKQAEQLEIELSAYVDNSLGIVIKENLENASGKILRTVNYKDFERWGVDAQTNTKITFNKKYRISTIAQISDISSGGTPSRSIPNYYTGDIPWVKTGEVVNDIIFETEEKITSEAIKNSSAKLYDKGSLIIAMYGQGKTRGRTAKLGVNATTNQACAVISNIDNSTIMTDYLWTYLINEYDRLRKLASGNNQPNLNAQMIKDYPVIIPPLDIQQKIIIEVFNLKQQIKDLKTKAEQNRKNAIKEFEQEIFTKN